MSDWASPSTKYEIIEAIKRRIMKKLKNCLKKILAGLIPLIFSSVFLPYFSSRK
jgi:hypothetical protein